MNNLEEQFEQAKQHLIQGEIDSSLSQFCNLLQQAQISNIRTSKFGETNYQCAKYYYGYANALLYKQELNQDVFGVEMPNQVENQSQSSQSQDDLLGAESSEEQQSQNQQIQQKKSQNQSQEEQHQNGENQLESDQEEGDVMNLIWENLETARFVCDNHWKEISQDQNVSDATKQEVLGITAKILKRLGDFLQIGDEFTKSIQEYQRCLEIRQQIDDPVFSRDLAELYQSYLVISLLEPQF